MRRFWTALPLLLFVALAGYFAVGLTRDPTAIPSALIDKPAPEMALPGLYPQGGGLRTADLVGEVALVNFFASWCAPCKLEQPALLQLKREGVRIYGIAYKDAPEAALAYLDETGNPYARIGVDRDGRTGIDWGLTGVPETFVIDRDGRVRKRHTGPLDDGTLAALRPLLVALKK